MRISELSERTHVSVATLKFYVREGLLRGRATAPNQAVYDEGHVERVRLIGALTSVCGLPLTQVRRVTEVLDDPDLTPRAALGRAVSALPPYADSEGSPHPRADRTLETLGIDAPAGFAAIDQLERALEGLEAAGLPWDEWTARRYATALRPLVAREAAPVAELPREKAIAFAVLGTALYEPVILALRRLLHAEATATATPSE